MTAPSHGYRGHAFCRQLEKGRSPGTLQIINRNLVFQCAEGEVTLPFNGLDISLGGNSKRLIFFRHPSVPKWELYTNDESILQDLALRQHPQVQAIAQAKHAKRRIYRSLAALVLLLILVSPLLFFWMVEVASHSIVEEVPVEWETTLGETVVAELRLEAEFMPQLRSDPLLETMVMPLLNAVDNPRFDYQFYIVNDADVNAFALPGGYIVINSGLILAVESAEEFLGVIAHEISHVSEQHGLRNLVKASSTFLFIDWLLGGASNYLFVLVEGAPYLINQSYSRQFEAEADAMGFALLQKAAIDPRGMLHFFQRMVRLEQEGNENVSDVMIALQQMASTHPATDERIHDLQQQLLELQGGGYQDFSVAFDTLQKRVAVFANSEKAQ